MNAFVAITDRGWFDFLAGQEEVDEVNFWQPSAGGGLQPVSPVVRPPPLVRDGQHPHRWARCIDDVVRKGSNREAPDGTADGQPGTGKVPEKLDGGFRLLHEPDGGRPGLRRDASEDFVEFFAGCRVEDRRGHFRRSRASRKTSSAAIASTEPSSSCSRRRWASSAHSDSYSSSPWMLERIAKASRSRSSADSFSASVASSSTDMCSSLAILNGTRSPWAREGDAGVVDVRSPSESGAYIARRDRLSGP